MAELLLDTPDEALAAFERARDEEDFDADPVEEIAFGDWATLRVVLPTYHSEMPAPFIDAYSRIQTEIYRLAAYVEYGSADVRNLTNDDLDRFQLVVKVTDGSAVLADNLQKIWDSFSEAAFSKMSGRQAVITVLGLALIASGGWGFSAYLESKKEVRLEEIKVEERKESLRALTFSHQQTVDALGKVISTMEEQGGAAKRAADTGRTINEDMLRAAARVPESEIGGVHLTKDEARELRSSSRRRSATSIVEIEMRVVDVNTSDPASTTVILEDLDSLQQHRVTFRDVMIAEASRGVVFAALAARGTAMFRLSRKTLEGDVVSVDILGVSAMPPAADTPQHHSVPTK